MEVSVLKTVKNFPVMGQILWFGDEYEPGFSVWQYTFPRSVAGGSTRCFRLGRVPKVKEVLEQIASSLAAKNFEYRPNENTRSIEPARPVRDDGGALHRVRDGELEMVIRPGRRGGPYFQLLRLTIDDPPLVAGWFHEEHIPTLHRLIDEAAAWLNEHSLASMKRSDAAA